MNIDAKLFATLRFSLGVGRVSIETEGPITVRELLIRIGDKVGRDITGDLVDEAERILPGTMILVGGRNIHHLEGLDTVVTEPEVAIFPPSGGG